MNILVTGGAGFIGSHLIERLLDQGHPVRVLDNFSSGKRENLSALPQTEVIEGDVRDFQLVCDCVRNMDAIVHLAAVASVQASIDDPIDTHQTNFGGTLNLLEAARRNGVRRFIFASSAAVYGDCVAIPVSETEPPKPLSPYAADKLACEHYIHFYANKFGLIGTAFRFFNIYGPRQDPSSPYSGVISIFVAAARAGKPVTIYGDGRQTRDFVYVGDLARLLSDALQQTSLAHDRINVGTGRESNLLHLLGELETLLSRPISRNHVAPRVGDIVRSCADTTRLKQALGYVPSTGLHDGLRHLLDYTNS